MSKESQKKRNRIILIFLDENPRSDISKVMAVINADKTKRYTRQEVEQGNLYHLRSVRGLVKSEVDHVTMVYSLTGPGKLVANLIRSQSTPRRKPLFFEQRRAMSA